MTDPMDDTHDEPPQGDIGEITAGLILGPAQMLGEFEDIGNASAAKANLDVFLNWSFTAPIEVKIAPPAIALIVNQCGLDPSEDRPRKVDWGGTAPFVYLEGVNVVLDPAPKSKAARDVVRKIFNNAKPKRIFDRPRRGGPPEGARAVGVMPKGASRKLDLPWRMIAFILAACAVAGFAAWFIKMRRAGDE